MATIRIVIDDLNNGRRNVINVPDNLEANQLVPALVNQYKLPLRNGNTVIRYKLVRIQNGHIFKDTDTIKSVGSAADEAFALLTEEQILEYIRESQRDQLLRIPALKEILFGLLVGIFFITFNFPKGVTNLGNTLGWSLVQDSGVTAKSVLDGLFGASTNAQTASFNNLWLGLVGGLLVYLVVLASLSLRHRRFDLFGLGSLCLFIGTACLQLVTWLVYLIGWLLYIIFIILAWVIGKLGFLFAIIGRVLGSFFGDIRWLLANIFGFLFGSGWWLLALLLVVIGISLAVKYRTGLFKAILWVLAACGIVALTIGVIYLLIKLFQFLAPFIRPVLGAIGQFLAPIFAFIGRILGVIFQFLIYLFIGLFVGLVVYGLGSLLVDQFRGAWHSGNGRRGVIIGALSIGTSLALVLLESNLGNVVRFYPTEGLQHFVVGYLYQANPNFSIVITLLIVVVSIVGILRNLPILRRGPSLRQFQITMVMVVPIFVLLLVLIAFSHWTENN